eukprot:COSAG05_NODE_598_length_8448_cov_204.560786_7_plen_68_part_00
MHGLLSDLWPASRIVYHARRQNLSHRRYTRKYLFPIVAQAMCGAIGFEFSDARAVDLKCAELLLRRI